MGDHYPGGPDWSASRHAEAWIRFYIIDALQKDGFFDYFTEPRNYGQIVAHFGLVDSAYTREVLEALSSGRRNVLSRVDGRYQRNPRVPLPTREQVARQTPKQFHGMTMWEDFARRIPARMRQEPIDYFRKMAQEEPAVVSFDQTLNSEVYAMLRKAAFAYIDVKQLRGARCWTWLWFGVRDGRHLAVAQGRRRDHGHRSGAGIAPDGRAAL